VVVKVPRWPFDKFPFGDRQLGTQMKATGEVMAIDRTFEAALLKAIRSLEWGRRSLLWEDPAWADNALDRVATPTDERIWLLMSALRRGATPLDLAKRTGIDPWFLERMARIVEMERTLLSEPLTPDLLLGAKRMGFSDVQIGVLADRLPEQVRELRRQWNIRPVYKMVDTCAAEFEAGTPYFYSTYEQENEAPPAAGNRALVIGSGPIRIGQGIEFDYASVHAAWALQEAGYRAIMANSNPETVSTDFDTSDRLYFEALDDESVLNILENEALSPEGLHELQRRKRPEAPAERGEQTWEMLNKLGAADLLRPPAAILQFGGQTAINLAGPLSYHGMPILGSSAEVIDLAEDRRRFERFLEAIGIPQPPGAAVTTVDEAVRTAEIIGYPVLVRPSYVLGGRAMEIVQNEEELRRYMGLAVEAGEGRPILIDKYFEGREVEVDAICDGEHVLIPGIMQHIERAGVHSGDSMAVYPAIDLLPEEVDTIVEYTTRIGRALDVRGLMNVQYVLMPRGEAPADVFVLEVNPRASRTVPFLSKVTGVPMVRLAVHIMLGRSLEQQGYRGGLWPRQPLVAIKVPVFSMSKLIGVDTYLGPEMKSTGEAMGIDRSFRHALTKALMAADLALPASGAALLSLSDRTKPEALPIVEQLAAAGYKLYATEGTAAWLRKHGFAVEQVTKRLREGRPNVVDVIQSGAVNCVINTSEGRITGTLRDGFHIRRAATERRIPCFTSLDTARAAVEALVAGKQKYSVLPMVDYLKGETA
jgi:carbamoyl-phosphate synthase large subunit